MSRFPFLTILFGGGLIAFVVYTLYYREYLNGGLALFLTYLVMPERCKNCDEFHHL